MALKKQISTFEIFCIASGVMISSGIFILPGIAFEKAGPAVFISYALAGIAALTGVLSIIELSTAMPKPGGDYFFITRSFGPVMGVIVGFFSWFSLSLKTAFAIFGIAEILSSLTGFSLIIYAIGLSVFFIVLNIRGVDIAVRFEVVIVITLLIIMVIYIVTGLRHVDIARFRDFAPGGIHSIYFTAGFVFVSFGGLLTMASLSGEVKNPAKSIPRGMISSIITVTLLYVLLLIVIVGTLKPSVLTTSLTPVADSSGIFLGKAGFIMISIAASLAFISTANAGILSASRYPVALSHDNLLPPWFSTIHKKFRTPVLAIGVTGVFIIGSLFLPLELLVKVASSMILFSYILTNVAVIIIRESKIQNYRPTFKVPFYPFIQIFSIIMFVFLLLKVGTAALETVIISIAISLLIYLFYGMKKHKKEFALLYLIERIINKKLSSDNLEAELKQILQKRDDIAFDRFHSLTEESIFIDIDKKITRDELFEMIAEQFACNLGLEPAELLQYFVEREEESSTALTPFLAIPHIIISGNRVFKMFVVRVKNGVIFSEAFNSVKAVFFLIGSKDERQFHLQALSAIAQITHNVHFEKQWLEAKNTQNLKDICLLSERRRATK